MPKLRYVLTLVLLVAGIKLGLVAFSTYGNAADSAASDSAEGSCPMASCIFDDTPDDD